MFPLGLSQAKSSKAMSILQPRIKKLQQQYKNDATLLNREMNALYKKYGVNPIAGCLPMLIQLPVLLALFSALKSLDYVGEGASFFWIPNLSEPDPSGYILPIIVGLSSFLQSKLTMASQPTMNEQARAMNMSMLYVMPVMLGWMTRKFAAGLALYWTTFNILGSLIQFATNKLVNRSQEGMMARVDADDRQSEIDMKRAEAEAKKEDARVKREALRKREEEKKTQKSKRDGRSDRKDIGQKENRDRGKAIDFD
jgi:YidC/Oxa1 family membrane protein insertase